MTSILYSGIMYICFSSCILLFILLVFLLSFYPSFLMNNYFLFIFYFLARFPTPRSYLYHIFIILLFLTLIPTLNFILCFFLCVTWKWKQAYTSSLQYWCCHHQISIGCQKVKKKISVLEIVICVYLFLKEPPAWFLYEIPIRIWLECFIWWPS